MYTAFKYILIVAFILPEIARATPEPVGISSVPVRTPPSAPVTTSVAQERTWAEGRWIYTDRRDEMTDKVRHMAAVRSLETVKFKFPYQNPQHPVLIIARDGLDSGTTRVAVKLDAGQFICNNGYGDSRDGCLIVVRFDDDPAERFPASTPPTHIRTMLTINNAEDFVVRAQKARKILIQTQVYQEGTQVFKFQPDVLGGVFAP